MAGLMEGGATPGTGSRGSTGGRWEEILRRADSERPTVEDAALLLREAPLFALGRAADRVRRSLHPDGAVAYIVDRNINYTNICISGCSFCAFFRDPAAPDAYVLSGEELSQKFEERYRSAGASSAPGRLAPGLGFRGVRRPRPRGEAVSGPARTAFPPRRSGISRAGRGLTLKEVSSGWWPRGSAPSPAAAPRSWWTGCRAKIIPAKDRQRPVAAGDGRGPPAGAAAPAPP